MMLVSFLEMCGLVIVMMACANVAVTARTDEVMEKQIEGLCLQSGRTST